MNLRENGEGSIENITQATTARIDDLTAFYHDTVAHEDRFFEYCSLEIPTMAFVIYGQLDHNSCPSRENIMDWWKSLDIKQQLKMIIVVFIDKGMMLDFHEQNERERADERFLRRIRKILKAEISALNNSSSAKQPEPEGSTAVLPKDIVQLQDKLDAIESRINQILAETSPPYCPTRGETLG